ncbi:hypothetical protein EYR41_002207 [Orbilia oligospora]|uniref:Uncharacterized protein n=1 Tax=Orbilia oligospora TaxID=2813651 RepID=A0A8H2HR03_ORBOL|nr:hypothetical protein EYR41_002207 [Orbilia oligospora]
MTFIWQELETEEGSETDSRLGLEDKGCEDLKASTVLSETEITKLLMERNDLKKERKILIIERNNWKLRKNDLIIERDNWKMERDFLTTEASDLRAEIDFLTTQRDRLEAEKKELPKLGFWEHQRRSFLSLTPEARKQKREADFAKSVRGESVQPTSATESATESNTEVTIGNTTGYASLSITIGTDDDENGTDPPGAIIQRFAEEPHTRY